MIKVIHIAPCPSGGGAEFIVRSLVDGLSACGISASAVYLANPQNVTLSSNEYCLGLSRPRSFRSVLLLRNIIKSELLKNSNVIIHAHLTWGLYYVWISSFRLNVKIVYTEHSTYNKRRSLPLLCHIERLVYSRYSAVCCISEGVMRSLKNWLNFPSFESRMKLIPNGSRSFENVALNRSFSQKVRLLSIGSLNHWKGFEYSIRAVSLCRNIVDSYHIVGEGPYRKHLECLIQGLGLERTVFLPGWSVCPSRYLADATLGIVPSVWEGFGLVPLEMLSAGLPLVATRVDGLKDILDGCPGVFFVEPKRPKEIAESIEVAAKNLVGLSSVSNAAVEHARKYSISKMLSLYSSLYNHLFEADF